METYQSKTGRPSNDSQPKQEDSPLSSAKPYTGALSDAQKSIWPDSKASSETSPTSSWKETNPKDIVGQTKLPLDLVPDTIEIEVALAYLEGALKYGRYNWRISGVRSSIYRSALRRHLAKWWNGEDRDRLTKVKHLASIIACAGILLDAELCGKLNDDRPPRAPIGRLIDVEPQIEHLKTLFKDYSPKQYTIKDGVEDEPT